MSNTLPAEASAGMPRLVDRTGYVAKPRDLAFAGVSVAQAQAMVERRTPLGFSSPEQWAECCQELREVLRQAGLLDADIRLQGSAAEYFSRNPDKPFPGSAAACRSAAEAHKLPAGEAEARWHRSPYAGADDLPGQSFWDSRFHLGIAIDRSDYDFQISSDVLAQRIAVAFPSGRYRRNTSVFSAHGGHYRDAVLRLVIPGLADWADQWQERLGRKLNLAGFPAAGPASDISRFSDQDWVIM